MRPIPGLWNDNSRPRLLTRRGCVCGMVAVAMRLPAQAKPRRIVSTAPSITEALFALGLGDQVVGVSRFCDFPASVQTLPKVGTYLAPDEEASARLVPDLLEVADLQVSYGRRTVLGSVTLSAADGASYRMAGVLPFSMKMASRLVKFGYVTVERTRDCLLGEQGAVLRGHSFHYSQIVDVPDMPTSYRVTYSLSQQEEEEGFRLGNVLTSYVRLHFRTAPDLARNFVQFARSLQAKEFTAA